MTIPLKKGVWLDPFTRIVNVGWNVAGRIAVLECSYSKAFAHPTITLSGLPFGTSFDLFKEVIYYSVSGATVPGGPENPPVVNPISKDMQKYLRMWNVKPHKVYTHDFVYSGTAMLFFNLSKIQPLLPKDKPILTFFISFPGAGPPQTITGTNYYVWFDYGDTFPGVAPNTYGGNVSFDSVWTTAEAAAERAAVLNVHSAYHVEPEDFEFLKDDIVGWDIRVSTYLKKVNFPVTPDTANPAWDVPATSKAQTGILSNPTEDPVTAHKVTIKIDTKKLTIEPKLD